VADPWGSIQLPEEHQPSSAAAAQRRDAAV
jgi:hypothetical protein